LLSFRIAVANIAIYLQTKHHLSKKMTKWAQKRQKSNKRLQISLIDNQRSFFNEGLDAPNDGLGIEVTIEPLIEASLEIEEEQHHFTCL
jgi:hypothetical protein